MGRCHDRTKNEKGIKREKANEHIPVIDRDGGRQISKVSVLHRTMKLLVLVLTVALLFTAGEALTCHRCVPRKAGGDCELSAETCKPGKDGCAAATFLREPRGHYQKCMALEDCEMLKMNAYIDIKCCREDLCNTL